MQICDGRLRIRPGPRLSFPSLPPSFPSFPSFSPYDGPASGRKKNFWGGGRILVEKYDQLVEYRGPGGPAGLGQLGPVGHGPEGEEPVGRVRRGVSRGEMS